MIRASAGLNLALDFLPGATTYDPVVDHPEPVVASSIVWFDALCSNVDRTARNTNMLMWHRRLWLIDHGAALYFHHAGGDYAARARDPFARIHEHVLLPFASALAEVDASLAARLTPDLVQDILATVPDAWLAGDAAQPVPTARRAAYAQYLRSRLVAPRTFVEEALRARTQHL